MEKVSQKEVGNEKKEKFRRRRRVRMRRKIKKKKTEKRRNRVRSSKRRKIIERSHYIASLDRNHSAKQTPQPFIVTTPERKSLKLDHTKRTHENTPKSIPRTTKHRRSIHQTQEKTLNIYIKYW